MNITTMTSPLPGEIATACPCASVSVKSAILPPTRTSCPHARILSASRPNGTRILLLDFDLQIDDRLLAGIERAQSSHRAGSALVLGFERIIHVRIQAVKLVRAVLLSDEGADLQRLAVLKL